MWNKLYLELNHFTENYSRKKAKYIKTRRYFLQTANFTNSNTEKSNVETNIQTEDTFGESSNIEATETIIATTKLHR